MDDVQGDFLGFSDLSLFHFLQLLDVMYREETLVNVMMSVTKNARSILLTALLGCIFIYLFSILGYIFFQGDFLMEVDPVDQIDQEDGKNLFDKL